MIMICCIVMLRMKNTFGLTYRPSVHRREYENFLPVSDHFLYTKEQSILIPD